MSSDSILIRGARQNNLKALDLDLPLGELIVVTGVSGSGKSSLAFDTVYSEGQRRYVETFSPYARQFLDRCDKPSVERIEGIPPAIAIDQTNPVRTSRSTVGTMTELNDHLKDLYARAAHLYCPACGAPVRRDTPEGIAGRILDLAEGARVVIAFPVTIAHNFSEQEVERLLARQGYTRIHARHGTQLEVVQDRLRVRSGDRARLVEDLEAALRHGSGQVLVHRLSEPRTADRPRATRARGTEQPDSGDPGASRAPAKVTKTWKFSAGLHCAECDDRFSDPVPSLFSFNSPLGACETCRGFGRTMGIDDGLVVPDQSLSLKSGAVKPFQSKSFAECQRDLMKYARRDGVPTDVPWRRLTKKQKRWVLDGEGGFDDGVWYGTKRFFEWLESKAYRMHIRVLLSKYRSYDTCPACAGARLVPEALNWRLGTKKDADAVVAPGERFRPVHFAAPAARFVSLPGLTLHDVQRLPLERAREFLDTVHLPAPLDEATELLLGEIRVRLRYLVQVGLGYLALDRQSRTLSGGEVQRINLTTALGTSLVNTLFVLDEPSIGLHARDMKRLVGVLHRLRDAGNTLLVVEHDSQVMLAADRVLDIGPGPGELGGEIVFQGSPAQLLRSARSLTAKYLRGEKSVAGGAGTDVAGPAQMRGRIELRGAAAHNLHDIDVDIPLHGLVCVTGVSGSGKSTLVHDVLYRALAKKKGVSVETPGAHRSVRGHEKIDAVVLVDQSPIGKTARSNPASYVGALTAIRKAFASEPLARERKYTVGTFSFNSGDGRCPACGGNGFEHVEMQFLSDVYLRCPDCDGRRFRAEVLEVKLLPPGGARAASIAGVLEMTVSSALGFFATYPDILRGLEPLAAVGLGYLQLGQPVPTLSGGEAQRLKLAGHLARAGTRKAGGHTLFLFDEPTTGLHFDDIATLLRAFRRLIAAGHSLIVIEHNLDVVAAADWIVDLGPEGGDGGGELVCAGLLQDVAAHPTSHTGAELREHLAGSAVRDARQRGTAGKRKKRKKSTPIRIHNAREHNLKNVDVEIPRDLFTVITGISGSGKSTIAFDILFAEGQRRYLESLNAYARQFVQPATRPDVDAIYGIPPTVAIEQRTSRGGRKSTVATMTELYHFIRLLFVKLGVQHCPDCDLAIDAQSLESVHARILREYRGRKVQLLAPLVVARKGYYTDLARWAEGKGFAHLRVDGVMTPADPWPRLDRFREHDIELPVGQIKISAAGQKALRGLLERATDMGAGMVKVAAVGKAANGAETLYSTRRACPGCGRSFPELDPRLFSYNSRHGWCEGCFGTGLELRGFDEEQSGEEAWWNARGEHEEKICADCDGQRLRPEALAVRFHKRSISELAAFPVDRAAAFFGALRLNAREKQIARDVLAELYSRLGFLAEVGLGYLALDRAAPTLSGGEAQRIRLAAQLGSNLQGVCYILDEPTIGLHARDNAMLLATLERLGAKGNTVVVVEHDEDTIRRAQHLIDIGPGAGIDGGRVVAQGSVRDLERTKESLTGRFLAAPLQHPLVERRPVVMRGKNATPAIRVEGAVLHNLRKLTVSFPLQRLICVTGVSGSGKSTLVREVLRENLAQLVAAQSRRKRKTPPLRGCAKIEGWKSIQRVLEVDQTPIGKTPRSCPATYVGFWNDVRKLFARTSEARIRGWGPGRFSFNVKGGRCEACEGQGMRRIEMSFLPDVRVGCDVCNGARFAGETLAVTWKDKHVAEVLAMSVDEAVDFFVAHPKTHHALRLLQDVGLGYLTLGQQSPTLSGGEAQRIKLVTELARVRPDLGAPRARGARENGALYVLDEPTIGLHMADVEKLIRVLHRLVDAGNTVIVIEHNLDMIAEADWIVDLGPEGGAAGGAVVTKGAPEKIAARPGRSHTAQALQSFLIGRSAG